MPTYDVDSVDVMTVITLFCRQETHAGGRAIGISGLAATEASVWMTGVRCS
jgi:hypothetical protein